MMNELNQTINRVNNMQTTENGALGYSTSGQSLVVLNFCVPSAHNNVKTKDVVNFRKSLKESLVDTVKWLFYLRDIREGLGERDSFINLYMCLYSYDQELAIKVLPLIPEFGRWKDIIDILERIDDNTSLADAIYDCINKRLKEDCKNLMENKPISLLAKWLPSVNSTQKARKLATRICRNKNIGMMFADYRKMLSKLRKYLDVTEVKTCGNQWDEIDYNKVSSNANSRYTKAFMNHDSERRSEYLQRLLSPVKCGAVMHASNLYPHEVYIKYAKTAVQDEWEYYNLYNDVKMDPSIEALWQNLKNIETTGNTMVVCDGSGSMQISVDNSTKAIDVSRSLSVFFSERCESEYKDKVIEFAGSPRYIDLSNCKTLADKFNVMKNYKTDARNTNIEKVFDLILMTAIDKNLSQDELPSNILIVSDMEFDKACGGCSMSQYKSLFENIKNEWRNAGYKMPQLVFWNVNSRSQTIPVTSNECGVALVSGFSVNNIKMVLSGDINPWTALKSVLDSDRYKIIEEVINS